MSINIHTYNDFYSWNRTGTAILCNDIVIESNYNPDTQPALVGTFEGNGKTVSIANGTFTSTGFKGLFHVEGGTVQNLIIDIGTNTMYNYYGIVNASANGYGTITKVFVRNNTTILNCIGGITCFCYNASHTLNINNCGFSGILGTNSGGIIGPSYARGVCNVNICKCYVSAEVRGSYGGGLVGGIGVSVPSIDQCIVKLLVYSPNICGGFLGNNAYSTTVSNSYVLISNMIARTSVGSFAYNGSGNLNFTNCYCLPYSVLGSITITSQAASVSSGYTLHYTNVASCVPLGTETDHLIKTNCIENYTNLTLSILEPMASFDTSKWTLLSPPILSNLNFWNGYVLYDSDISINLDMSCLLSDTLIKLQDGTFMLIQDIKVGTILWKGIEVVKNHEITVSNVVSNYPRLYRNNYLSGGHAYLENGKWHHPMCSGLPKVQLPSEYLTFYHIRTKNYFTDTLFLKDGDSIFEVETYADGQEHIRGCVWTCSPEECVLNHP